MKKYIGILFFFFACSLVEGAVVATTTWTFNQADQFYYDVASITIGASAKLKDTKPADLTFYATFAASTTATYAVGSSTATASGTGLISGSKLVLTGGGTTVKYVYFNPVTNADSAQTGTIRCKYYPNYSGTPATNQFIFEVVKSTTTLNELKLFHSTTGNLQLLIRSSTGAVLVNNVILGAWAPTSGTLYELELNWDLTAGATRCFINGTQLGSTITTTGTRSTDVNRFIVGAREDLTTSYPNFSMSHLEFFSVVQHTANYTAPHALPYVTRYDINNPEIYPVSSILSSGFLAFTASTTATSPDSVKWALKCDGVDYYYNTGSSAWQTSAGYSQSNTAAQISSWCVSLHALTTLYARPIAYFHSATGTGTPTIFNCSLQYLTGNASDPTICRVSGRVYLGDNSRKSGAVIKAVPERDAWVTSLNTLVLADEVTYTTGAQGTFYLDLIRSSNYERNIRYKITITSGNRVAFSRWVTIPARSLADLSDL